MDAPEKGARGQNPQKTIVSQSSEVCASTFAANV